MCLCQVFIATDAPDDLRAALQDQVRRRGNVGKGSTCNLSFSLDTSKLSWRYTESLSSTPGARGESHLTRFCREQFQNVPCKTVP